MQDKHENNTRRVSQTAVENKLLPLVLFFYRWQCRLCVCWPVSKFAHGGKGIIDLSD